MAPMARRVSDRASWYAFKHEVRAMRRQHGMSTLIPDLRGDGWLAPINHILMAMRMPSDDLHYFNTLKRMRRRRRFASALELKYRAQLRDKVKLP